MNYKKNSRLLSSICLLFFSATLVAQSTFPEGESGENVLVKGGNIDIIAPDKNPNIPDFVPNFFSSAFRFLNENEQELALLRYSDFPGSPRQTIYLGFKGGEGITMSSLGQVFLGDLRGIGANRSHRLLVNGKSYFDDKVGIGTIDPKNELSVNGTIWAKEVIVSLDDGADWVFEDDYNLKPLAEVEAFIKRNKHLPEMPSADDFRANDMKVSEMTNRLLQKIEELTLYTIEQEKQLKQQTKKLEKVEVLTAQNEALEARLIKLETLLVK